MRWPPPVSPRMHTTVEMDADVTGDGQGSGYGQVRGRQRLGPQYLGQEGYVHAGQLQQRGRRYRGNQERVAPRPRPGPQRQRHP